MSQNTVNITLRLNYSASLLKRLYPYYTSEQTQQSEHVGLQVACRDKANVLHILLRIKVSSEVLGMKKPCPCATKTQIYSSQYFRKNTGKTLAEYKQSQVSALNKIRYK